MRTILLSLFAVLVFTQCGTDAPGNHKPGAAGDLGDILVVMDDHHWKGAAGDTIRVAFEAFQYGMPYPGQPMFQLRHTDPKDLSRLTKVNRNILLVNIKDLPQYKKAKVKKTNDLWANGQIVFQVYTATAEDFINTFNEYEQVFIDEYNLQERAWNTKKFNDNPNYDIQIALKKDHQLSVTVPEGFDLKENKADFVWLQLNRMRKQGKREHDVNQDIFIYTYPYTDDSTFTMEYLINKRDSICKHHVPGAVPGSYLATQYEYQPPQGEETMYNEQFAVEMRGLSKMVGDHRGGPFISLTTLDEKNNRIITVEGTVFAPNFKKREYLRELEAILYSLEY